MTTPIFASPLSVNANRSLSKVLRDDQIAPLSRMRSATLNKIEHAVIALYSSSQEHEVTMHAIAQHAHVSL